MKQAETVRSTGEKARTSLENVRDMLLAIWATEKNNCDQSRCSLGRCVIDIDKSLREGQFTFEPKKGKKRYQNPGVIKAPSVIKEYIGVENLTMEQNCILNCSEDLQWINGPAGAGKTVLLCGKMIQLAHAEAEKKVVLVRFIGDGNSNQFYQCAFDKAGVLYEEVLAETEFYDSNELEILLSVDLNDITNLTTEVASQAIVVNIPDYKRNLGLIRKVLSSAQDCHVFIDDVHVVLYYSTAEECRNFIDLLLQFSSRGIVWIASDLVQGYYFEDTHIVDLVNVIIEKLDPNQRAVLSMNLRNTLDLSNTLSVIRDQFIKQCPNRSDVFDLIVPKQIPGHFIHGPRPILHIIDKFDVHIVGEVLNKELDKLFHIKSEVRNSDVGIVYNYVSEEIESSVIKTTINDRCGDAEDVIAVCHSEGSFSAEWPAIVVLYEMNVYSERDLSTLYLAVSRARVHCAIVLYPGERKTPTDHVHLMRDMPQRLRDYVHIIQH